MCKIVHVAVQIVNECIKKNIPIDYFKVQKLSYLCQIEHLKKYNVPLAPEEVMNWSCGAGFREIYAYFKKNGYLSKDEEITIPINKQLDLLTFEKETIDLVIEKYAQMSFEEIKLLYAHKDVDIGQVISLEVIKKSIGI